MDLHRSCATLGFYGDDLDPEELTALLGANPTVGVRKGGTWRTTMGADKVAPTGSWRMTTDDCEPADLSGQIDSLLRSVTPNLTVWRELTERFRCVIFCGLWLKSFNEGLQITPKTLAAMGERGLVLDFDIYGADSPN